MEDQGKLEQSSQVETGQGQLDAPATPLGCPAELDEEVEKQQDGCESELEPGGRGYLLAEVLLNIMVCANTETIR